MKKVIGIILAILGLAAVAAGVIVLIINLNKTEPNHIEISLRSNDGVPYAWTYEITDGDIIELTSQSQEKLESSTATEDTTEADAEDAQSSVTIKDKFSFEGKKEGETDLIFTFKHNETSKVGATKTYHVTVDKRLQSTVVETTTETE